MVGLGGGVVTVIARKIVRSPKSEVLVQSPQSKSVVQCDDSGLKTQDCFSRLPLRALPHETDPGMDLIR